jgi:hypothetical protein
LIEKDSAFLNRLNFFLSLEARFKSHKPVSWNHGNQVERIDIIGDDYHHHHHLLLIFHLQTGKEWYEYEQWHGTTASVQGHVPQ